MQAESLLKDSRSGWRRPKRKGYDDMHTLTSSVEVKKLDPKDADEVEM